MIRDAGITNDAVSLCETTVDTAAAIRNRSKAAARHTPYDVGVLYDAVSSEKIVDWLFHLDAI